MNNWITVQRATATTPQGTAAAIFTVSGRVFIDQIIGEVTTEIGAGANNMKLVANPTVKTDVDLCAVVDIDGDTVGTLYHITGTLANAMLATGGGAFEAQPTSVFVADGTIDLNCTGSTAGSIKWTVIYRALDSGSTVVAA
jgi:hypothetical protein